MIACLMLESIILESTIYENRILNEVGGQRGMGANRMHGALLCIISLCSRPVRCPGNRGMRERKGVIMATIIKSFRHNKTI